MVSHILGGKISNIVLASASPRRAQLLRQIGLEFQILPSQINEPSIGSQPVDTTKHIAYEKAKAVVDQVESGLIIGADTTVEFLKKLSGNLHHVITGVALIDLNRKTEVVWSETTSVFFRRLRSEEIKAYVASGEANDKAGAYGIQGKAAAFVERIEGCYFNVVGVPLASLTEKLYQIR